MEENHEWYLKFQGKKYPVEYRVYCLSREGNGHEVTLHEIEYKGRTVTKQSLESAVREISRIIRRKE